MVLQCPGESDGHGLRFVNITKAESDSHYFTDLKAHKESHCISKVVTSSVLFYIFCNLILLNGGEDSLLD